VLGPSDRSAPFPQPFNRPKRQNFGGAPPRPWRSPRDGEAHTGHRAHHCRGVVGARKQPRLADRSVPVRTGNRRPS